MELSSGRDPQPPARRDGEGVRHRRLRRERAGAEVRRHAARAVATARRRTAASRPASTASSCCCAATTNLREVVLFPMNQQRRGPADGRAVGGDAEAAARAAHPRSCRRSARRERADASARSRPRLAGAPHRPSRAGAVPGAIPAAPCAPKLQRRADGGGRLRHGAHAGRALLREQARPPDVAFKQAPPAWRSSSACSRARPSTTWRGWRPGGASSASTALRGCRRTGRARATPPSISTAAAGSPRSPAT